MAPPPPAPRVSRSSSSSTRRSWCAFSSARGRLDCCLACACGRHGVGCRAAEAAAAAGSDDALEATTAGARGRQPARTCCDSTALRFCCQSVSLLTAGKDDLSAPAGPCIVPGPWAAC